MSSRPEAGGDYSENNEPHQDAQSERVIDRQRRDEVLKHRLVKRRAEEARQRAKRLAELDSLLEEAESERYLAQRRLQEIEARAERHKALGQAVAKKRLARGLQQPSTELPPVTPRQPLPRRPPPPRSKQPTGQLPAGDRTRIASDRTDHAAGSGESPEHGIEIHKPERDGSVRSKARVRKHMERQRQEEAERRAKEAAEKMEKQERKREQAEAIKEQRAAAARRAAERMQREKAAREAAKAEEIKAENLAREKAKAYSSPEKIAKLKAGQEGDNTLQPDELKPLEAPAEAPRSLWISEAAAQALFRELDRNRDGRVSYYELKMKMAKDGELEKLLGMKDAKKHSQLMYRVHEVQRRLDANGDGYISEEEFVKLFKAPGGDIAAGKAARQSPRLSDDDLSCEDESSLFARTVHAVSDEDWWVEINVLRPSGN
eukprot:TRINITY_DN26203_c0_g1_i1.p1 TRINITY_DN26203_c0_g1~~TRINITY_DN26203_c0_g1_i1.p1  ORF type:complete len:432 (-),score=106.68 TRINITY_DN26203_c0_g1_i1:484-1779(-)